MQKDPVATQNDPLTSRYVFKISDADVSQSPILDALFNHVGPDGRIIVEVRNSDTSVTNIFFSGSGYHSTTTVVSINKTVPILPPDLSQQ